MVRDATSSAAITGEVFKRGFTKVPLPNSYSSFASADRPSVGDARAWLPGHRTGPGQGEAGPLGLHLPAEEARRSRIPRLKTALPP